MRMFRVQLLTVFWMAALLLSVPAVLLGAEAYEEALSAEEFKKLDTYEGIALAKADKIYSSANPENKLYRQAKAEYEAFIAEFPKSPAMAYAVLRKARSIHLDNKRFDAIKAYNDVLDYFPNAVNYAAAALFYIGQCHDQNGAVKEAMKSWSELVADVDYKKHRLAAFALNRLADNLFLQERAAEGVEFYKTAAIDFRESNRDASRYAVGKVVEYYVRGAADEPKLRDFYNKVQGFDERRIKPTDDDYWPKVRAFIRALGGFGKESKDLEARKRYFGYWAKVMADKRPQDEDFQIDQAAFQLYSDDNEKKWIARLDQLFSEGQKKTDYLRVIKWISLFRAQKKKVEEYYTKLNFSRMTAQEIRALMRVMYDDVGDAALAENLFMKISLDNLSEVEKRSLAEYMADKDRKGNMVEKVCDAMRDIEAGRMILLRYLCLKLVPPKYEKAYPLADECAGFPKYSKEAFWLKAGLFCSERKYAEAIGAYQSCDDQPRTLWAIADCYLAMGKRDMALEQLMEIENFFVDQSSKACLRIAFVWRDAGNESQYVAQLRSVMKKYPKSGESNSAHQELERLGKNIGGAVDAE